MQQHLLRSRVARIGVGADRFDAEGPEPVIDDRGDRFSAIAVAPIWLAQPVAERGLGGFGFPVALEAHAGGDAIGLLPRAGEAAPTADCAVFPHAADPPLPVRFAVSE